jgi:uncharacterized protein (DUF1501 family)
MALTRRQFLTRTGLLTAGGIFGPSLFRNPLLRKAYADTIGDRYFVVLFLDGGNDGLNTVTPIDNGTIGGLRAAYEAMRFTGTGGLQLPASSLLATEIDSDPNTGAPLALHPGLIGLKNLYDSGRVAVIQGCGYPRYSLSHEQSRIIWETANPLGNASFVKGWVGRHLQANYGPLDIPAVSISTSVAREFQQTGTSVLAVSRVRDFTFPFDDYDSLDNNAKRDAFLACCANASVSTHPALKYVGDSGTSTHASTERFPALHALYEAERLSWSRMYDSNQAGALRTSTARDLREVAKVIYGISQGVPDVDSRFFWLSNGGYDTHGDQGANPPGTRHYSLLREIGDAVELFYNDCADMGVANKVCVMVWSEFSRRILQNDNGTDHGSQGPVFVIGGAVNGGVYGNHPNVNEDALDDEGNTPYSQAANDLNDLTKPFRATDFRDVYGTLLKHWLNVPDPGVLLPLDTGDPNVRWTVPNYDLGFVT